MVGVAGRSKACHTCRERRIRCGSEKPSCSNCLKSGRSCAGYQKRQAFILSHYTKTPAGEFTTYGSGTLQTAYEAGNAPLFLSRYQAVRYSSHAKHHQLAATTRLPKFVSTHNTTRDQFLAIFIDGHLPSPILIQGQLNDHRKWLLRLPEIPLLSPALEHAILALSTAAIEKNGGLGDGAYRSLPLYTRGLRELQRAIDDPELRLHDQTIAACVLLGMFEFSECPGRTIGGYMKHYQGAMTLLQLRGPGQHIGGLAHDVFQVLRMHTAFQGLGQRTPTLLAQPAWMEEPWSSKSKTMHDQLLDIFLQIPRLLSEIKTKLSSQSCQELCTNGRQILSSCVELDKRLEDWFTAYQSTTPTLYWPQLSATSSSTDCSELGKLYPVCFQFASYHVGETMLLYWTVQVLLYASVCSLHSRIFSLDAELATTSLKDYDRWVHSKEYSGFKTMLKAIHESGFVSWPDTSARYICQSVEYFFNPEFRGIGSGVVLPPLIVLKTCLASSPKDYSREVAWIDEMIIRIRDNGTGLAGCM